MQVKGFTFQRKVWVEIS